MRYWLAAAFCLFACGAQAQQNHHARPRITCPNASPSVTIPLSGTATVTVYDQSCVALSGPWQVIGGATVLSATTSPSFVLGAGGVLQFAANGAPAGTAGNIKIVYSPNGMSANLAYTVGAPVTSLSFGTTTP